MNDLSLVAEDEDPSDHNGHSLEDPHGAVGEQRQASAGPPPDGEEALPAGPEQSGDLGWTTAFLLSVLQA